MTQTAGSGKSEHGGFRPERLQIGPLYRWPPQLWVFLKSFFGFPGYLWPWAACFFGVALVSWVALTPDLDDMKSLSVGWIAPLFIRNLALLVAFVSMWHVWLYTLQSQGTQFKYNSSWLAADDTAFLFRNQLWDNIFWNVCSGVPIWTAYEALSLWLHANSYVQSVTWQANPLYCVALILLTPIWYQTHFYVTHRLIHWKPLYRSIHHIHHRNINMGPWSGISMHPIEHIIYFSAITIFWVVPSHPMHAQYLLVTLALGGALGHSGFHRVVFGSKSVSTGHYMHYLHHKYFTVNYATDLGLIPLDVWFGTFHDGSDEAIEKLRKRMRSKARAKALGSKHEFSKSETQL